MQNLPLTRAELFESFCNEWIASSAYLEIFASCISEGKDLEIVFPDGTRRVNRITDYLFATIRGKPHCHNVLAPYSRDTLDLGYYTLAGTFTPEEEKEFFEAWTAEDEGWVHFTEAIAAAMPAMADSAHVALANYRHLVDYTIAYYHGEFPNESPMSIYEIAMPLEAFIAEFISAELDRREKATNVKSLVVKL